ncbi:hypothetical protein BM221_010328 [Beauveria bassiana]|uniref:Phosphoribosylaminoimidazole-succinocarboxamide synthase n=1 Tax=Beauveria bassiana TaxID=176275 RepID=A0A2N6N9B0_BEABA|nr:hypothetical protein BM221_010328 [Beauveria bassiana]
MNIFINSADNVAAPRPWSSQVPDDNLSDFGGDSDSTVRHRLEQHHNSSSTPSPHSLSPQPTLTRRNIPPPSPLTSSPDLYGPDRSHIFTRLLSRRATQPERTSPGVRFDQTQLPMFAAVGGPAPMSGLKDELALAAGKVTPGVDDAPYIQYALSALTRDRSYDAKTQPHYSPQTASEYFTHLRRTNTVGEVPSRHLPAVSMPDPAYTRHDAPVRPTSARLGAHSPFPAPIHAPVPGARDSPALSIPIGDAWDIKDPSSAHWVAVTENMRQSLDPHGRTYPPLTYKPSILRPFSMMILMALCLGMTAALIFCVQYSTHHHGLTPYPGSIYTAQFFLFRILPQLLGAVILIYAQSIVNTSMRILPFASLASEDPQQRYLALFTNLYPKSLLYPQLVGPWQIMLFDLATWLALFSVPLLSASFTCIHKSIGWVWAPVPVVVWILVALYALIILSTAIVMVFWFGKWTGLSWDVRSIGDLLPLLNRSNAISSFDPHNLSGSRHDFQTDLRDRWFDRLGYWRSGDMITGGVWYSIGAVGARGNDAKVLAGIRQESDPKTSMDSDSTAAPGNWRRVHERYLPMCIQFLPLIMYTVLCTLLVVALLLVSFLPQTRIDNGFRPLLAARPGNNAFSAANFLYAFIPSVMGMLVWLFFQPIDMALRRLQPWADLSQLDGATASRSILADYAACLPLQVTWKAARNGHWRVALLSLMAQAFVAIPVLGGGLFMALSREDGQVRMYPSMPVFGMLVAFLLLYVGCLSLAVPRRAQFELPRPVTSIAAIMSLCSARELTQDSAFRSVRSRQDLEGRLGVGRDPREETVWFYGVVAGRDEHRVSVRRMQRYTEKRRVRTVEAMV